MTVYLCPDCREGFQFRAGEDDPRFCPFCGVEVEIWSQANEHIHEPNESVGLLDRVVRWYIVRRGSSE